jgi:hypothetical protein
MAQQESPTASASSYREMNSTSSETPLNLTPREIEKIRQMLRSYEGMQYHLREVKSYSI